MLPLENKLLESWSLCQWQDVTVLVAVSGGADSVALLRAIVSQKTSGDGRILAAHFNHRLRLADSERDAQFVQALCQSLGVDLCLGQAELSLSASHHGDGLEAAARAARYEFLKAEAHRLGARYVVTAHTADDQAETILHRILRGTGVGGLAGIPRTRALSDAVTIIRPLLGVHRSEILAYLESLQQNFCDDQTNLDPRFTRNRIRHQLIPALAADYNPHVVDSLLRLGTLAEQAQQVIDAVVSCVAKRAILGATKSVVQINCIPLADQFPHVVRELFVTIWKRQQWPAQNMTYEHWENLLSISLDKSIANNKVFFNKAAMSLPGGVTAVRNGDFLRLDFSP